MIYMFSTHWQWYAWSTYSLLYTCMLGTWIKEETKYPAHHVWPAHYSTNCCSCTCIITSFSKLVKTFLLFNFDYYIQTLGPSSSDFFLGLLPNLISWASQTVYSLLAKRSVIDTALLIVESLFVDISSVCIAHLLSIDVTSIWQLLHLLHMKGYYLFHESNMIVQRIHRESL